MIGGCRGCHRLIYGGVGFTRKENDAILRTMKDRQ